MGGGTAAGARRALVRGPAALFLVGAAGLGALLVWGLAGLPDYRDFTRFTAQSSTGRGRGANTTAVVTAVNFDYRGFDTLGEEFILFAAVLVLALLLRRLGEEGRARPRASAHVAGIRRARRCGRPAWRSSGPTVLLSIYITMHGHLTPGGGFQGGVIAATALLLALPGRRLRRRCGACGRWAFVEVGAAAGAAEFRPDRPGGADRGRLGFLENFLPLGTPGELCRPGTIPLLSLAVGIEVAGGFMLLFSEFLDQLMVGSGAGRARRLSFPAVRGCRWWILPRSALYGVVTSRHLVHTDHLLVRSCSRRRTCCCSPLGYRRGLGRARLHRHPARHALRSIRSSRR